MDQTIIRATIKNNWAMDDQVDHPESVRKLCHSRNCCMFLLTDIAFRSYSCCMPYYNTIFKKNFSNYMTVLKSTSKSSTIISITSSIHVITSAISTSASIPSDTMTTIIVNIIICLTILNLQGKSDLKTPDSSASTWPPTYVSESRTWPSSVNLLSIDSCLFGKTMFASNAFTIRSASHRVPEPFLNT